MVGRMRVAVVAAFMFGVTSRADAAASKSMR
jgi:hypothetical protein